ncbi:MAG: CocE/NonD family hydrolase [Bacteroidota bacterium]
MVGRSTLLWVAVFLFTTALAAQPTYDVQAHYTKREHLIPVRDGVKLFTAVYAPKDTSKTYPILLTRSPYSSAPYGEDRFPTSVGNQRARYFRDGYIIVVQDVRGRYMSEGEFENVRPYRPEKRSPQEIDESSDTYDTVEWLLKNLRQHNGRVGISGISYPGFYTWMGTIGAHPAVKATSPQAPVSQWMSGDDFYHNGAFMLPHAFNFYSWVGWPRPVPKSEPDRCFDHGTPDEYDFFLRMGALRNANELYLHDSVAFWNTLFSNGQWNDFWAGRSILPHLKNIRPAVLVVGGWFDTENLYGALHSYASAERQSTGSDVRLVMGPWYHGQWNNESGDSLGRIQWNASTSAFYTDSIESPFFAHHLKDGPVPDLPEAFVFNTGEKAWHRMSTWPPSTTREHRMYLNEGARLTTTTPDKAKRTYDEYVSDPARPVPYTNEITDWYNPAFMLEDQRFASRRPDVLVYRTEPLAEDVTIAGPITVDLTVSTSGTDCDWIVKVIDVYPDRMGDASAPFSYQGSGPSLGGYQMLIRGDVQRGKFRNSLSKPEPFAPNTPTTVHFTLQDAFHTFRKGHRVMVQVQSTWFPMIDRNPGVFLDIYRATDADFSPTTQRVYRSPDAPSSIMFHRLP